MGSDYTNGIDGIGPVSAIEILSFFESKNRSKNIEEKLLKIKEIVNSKSEVYSDIPCLKKLKNVKVGSGKYYRIKYYLFVHYVTHSSKFRFPQQSGNKCIPESHCQ